MTKEMIGRAINERAPGVYAPTTELIKLTQLDKKYLVGYFDHTEMSDNLEKDNQYTFIEIHNAEGYRSTRDSKYITTVNGDLITRAEHLRGN